MKNPNFKFKLDIITDGLGYFKNFEVFKSHKDNKDYIAIIKNNTYDYIDIFSILDKKILFSLKDNKDTINTIRYFINHNFNEYLVSSDFGRMIIIWDITNDYNVKHKIDMKLIQDFMISSCLLIFTHNKADYMISTANNVEEEYEESLTKIYSFNSGKLLREINNSRLLSVFYLLSWYNENNGNYYVVQTCNSKILINDLVEEKLYCEFLDENNSYFHKGFIYSKDNNDYLCCCSSNGYIKFWDLYNKIIINVIYLKGFNFSDIIHWNDKCIITKDRVGENCQIIDIENKKIISNIKSEDGFRCIKKIYHPIYGESLLNFGDNGIKLWYS